MRRLVERCNYVLADWLVRGRTFWILLGLTATVAAYVHLNYYQPLNYNRSMESFFPKSDTRLQLYQQFKGWFRSEATLLVVYTDKELWTPAGMDRQLKLRADLLQVRGVATVTCLADSPFPGVSGLGQSVASVVKKSDGEPKALEGIRQAIRKSNLQQGVLVANDGFTTAHIVLLAHQDTDSVARCMETVRARAVQSLAGAAVQGPHAAGTLLMIHDVYAYTEEDGKLLEGISVLLMSIVIAFTFRSLRWILLPLIVVYATLYWSLSLWGAWHGEMTMVGSAISSLVAVFGVSTVVHYGMLYRELRPTASSETAMWHTLVLLGPPIFWVLLTNAGGFGALLVCEIRPVTDFAWIMMLASMLVGVAVLVFVPFGAMELGSRPPRSMVGESRVQRLLLWSLDAAQRRPWLTALGLIAPLLAVSYGMFKLEPQTDFTNNFRRDTVLFQAYDFIERNYGGAGQLDLIFDADDLYKMDDKQRAAFIQKLRQLEKTLSELPAVKSDDGEPIAGVTKVLGLADFVDAMGTDALSQKLAPLELRLLVLEGRFEEAQKQYPIQSRLLVPLFKDRPATLPQFWNRTEKKMRITLQVRERLPSDSKKELIAAVRKKASEVLGEGSKPQTTGIYVMLAHLIESLLDDQNRTFALSLLLMFLMALAALRSISLALITMIPTVLPVVAVVGTMGWVGLPVNIATAMLASVAMGMTIDSSLLYLYRFREERRNGADFNTALHRTHGTTGLALVVANLALIVGFGVLTLSRFIPLIHFGILTALALLGGLVGNLILLPLLLQLLPGLKREPTRSVE
jgi:hypothetical protein